MKKYLLYGLGTTALAVIAFFKAPSPSDITNAIKARGYEREMTR